MLGGLYRNAECTSPNLITRDAVDKAQCFELGRNPNGHFQLPVGRPTGRRRLVNTAASSVLLRGYAGTHRVHCYVQVVLVEVDKYGFQDRLLNSTCVKECGQISNSLVEQIRR